MTAAPLKTEAAAEQPLDAVLRLTHAGWLEHVRRQLDPALDPGADFWTRWAAVRYLNDEFLDRFQRELALVDELHPFLSEDASERLRRAGALLARLRLEVDRIGRRRGTAAEVAAATLAFLDQLVLWCAEIDACARGIPWEALTGDVGGFLVHLERIRQ